MNDQQTLSALRSLLIVLGGVLGTLGFVDAAHVGIVIDAVMGFVGAGLALWTALQGIWAKTHPKIVEAAADSIVKRPDIQTAAPVVAALRAVGAKVDVSNLPLAA